ncbi:telomere-protecting terminal protein Tpg [Streptomyces sp. NPDC017179]|uniref:telomere-protecting terminal protein Tpg n=1 Tax=Streptomyces sp. NPDC017179 TaxID=3364979 RepID=UPI00378C9229
MVERCVSGKLKRSRRDLRGRVGLEVKKWWQPLVRVMAGEVAASAGGLVVCTRAGFGFAAVPGTTDDARIRDITRALPAVYADQLFTAREQGAIEQQVQQIAADGLARIFFGADNSRVHGLGVEFTDVEQIECEV